MATQREDQGRVWATGLHRRIAITIREARTRAEMSAQDVADATQELGYALSRDKIANYEAGRKQGLDIAELLVIAAALRVPPVSLLFDGHPREDVELLPGQQMPNVSALAWFSADDTLVDDAVAQIDSPFVALLQLTRQRASKHRLLEMARHMASFHAGQYDETNFTGAIETFMSTTDDMAEIDAAIDKEWAAIVAEREERK